MITLAGSERFNAITNSHYRGAVGCILMYDVTDAKSFQNISKWLKDTREKADENVKCLLVRKLYLKFSK